MRNSKIRGNIIMLFTLLYIVYLSVVTYLLNSQGLFISLVDVSITNIGRRLIGDCASIIFLSILIFIAICNNMQIQTGLTWGSSRGLVIFLAAAYFCLFFRFLYKGIIIKHNKTEPTYTKTSLFLCEKRRFLWPGLRKEGNLFKLAGPGGLAFFHLTKKEVSKWPMKK